MARCIWGSACRICLFNEFEWWCESALVCSETHFLTFVNKLYDISWACKTTAGAPLYGKQEGSKIIVSIKTTEPVFMEQKCKYYSVRHDLGCEARWKRISTSIFWLRALSLAPARSLAETSSNPETRSRWSVLIWFPNVQLALFLPFEQTPQAESQNWERFMQHINEKYYWKQPLTYRLKFNVPCWTFFKIHISRSMFQAKKCF